MPRLTGVPWIRDAVSILHNSRMPSAIVKVTFHLDDMPKLVCHSNYAESITCDTPIGQNGLPLSVLLSPV